MQEENENNIIKMAQNGDKKAFDEIIAKYTPYIKRIVRKYFLVNADLDDLMQIGFVSMCKAVDKYNLESKASFKSYLYMTIQGDIKNEITKSQNEKHKAKSGYINLGSTSDDPEEDWAVVLISDAQSPEEEVIEKQKVKQLMAQLKSSLKPQEKSIINLYLQGYKYSEIASKVGVTTKQVDNTLTKAKRVLEKFKKEYEI